MCLKVRGGGGKLGHSGSRSCWAKKNLTPTSLDKIRIHSQESWAGERKIPFCLFALPNSYGQVVQQQLNGTHNDIIDWNYNRREWEEQVGGGRSGKGGKWRCICVIDKRQVLFLNRNKWRTRWGYKLRSESFPYCFLFKQFLHHSLKLCSNVWVEKQQYKTCQIFIFKLWIRRGFKGLIKFGWALKCSKNCWRLSGVGSWVFLEIHPFS